MFVEFKAFLTKSNALALAIGVIIGAALGAVVNSLVTDIIMPPIGYVLGGVNFDDLKIVLAAATGGDPATEVAIRYGAFIEQCITFLAVALVVFLIAKALIKEPEAAPAGPTDEVKLLTEIRDALTARWSTGPASRLAAPAQGSHVGPSPARSREAPHTLVR